MSTQYQLEDVLSWLESQNIRTIMPFSPRTSYCNGAPSGPLLKAAIIDTETTGTDFTKDKIIELGIVLVEYDPQTGQVYQVLETFNALESPGMPIPPETIKVHGITDDMVAGQKIDDKAVEQLLSDVSFVIAHNAAFDRAFLEARMPFTRDKAWGCSLTQIPWRAEGFGAAGLEFLAYKSGFHFHGHRASIDCHALLEVLQTDLPISKIKPFKVLLDNAKKTDIKLSALNTGFDKKDLLKRASYRWDGERKVWYKSIAEENLASEVDWLRSAIYEGKPFTLNQEKMNAFNRFSQRVGATETIAF